MIGCVSKLVGREGLHALTFYAGFLGVVTRFKVPINSLLGGVHRMNTTVKKIRKLSKIAMHWKLELMLHVSRPD